VRAINAAAQAGKIHAAVVCATVEVLLLPEWITLLPYLVRFISCLLAACFNNRVKSSAAVDLVVVAVRSLVSFIDARSVVREEVSSNLSLSRRRVD
jgi:thiamine transporter ThiT